jgi:hypothetical protein
LWREKNIANYNFEIQRFAEGIGGDWNLKFNVRDNKTLPLENKYNYPSPKQYEEISSVEKLFDYTQKLLETGYQVNVKFDEEYGFPEDIAMKTEGTGYLSIEIKKFEIVK